MTKRKKQVNKLEKIESYFTTENEHYNRFTLAIYIEAKENNLFHDIETPLRYFNDYVDIFYVNQTKPLQVSKQFFQAMNSEGLNTEQQIFITEHLVSWFKGTVFKDENNKEYSLQKVADILQKEIEALKPEKMKNKKPFDWSETQQHLETLPDTKAKIKYLIEQKTRYKQESGYDFESPDFGEKCELEIKKLKALAELESTPAQTKVKPQLGQYSNSQLVLIFYYFFKQNGLEPRVSIDIAPIAKFLHLVTGKEFTAVNNSDFYKKLQSVPNFKTDKTLIEDLQAIKPLFQKVELNEIVKMIDNEIDLARSETKQARTQQK